MFLFKELKLFQVTPSPHIKWSAPKPRQQKSPQPGCGVNVLHKAQIVASLGPIYDNNFFTISYDTQLPYNNICSKGSSKDRAFKCTIMQACSVDHTI